MELEKQSEDLTNLFIVFTARFVISFGEQCLKFRNGTAISHGQ